MGPFNFQVPVMNACPPQEWLRKYAAAYDRDEADYEKVYRDLIQRHTRFTADDFRTIGKWKDDAWTEKQWNRNVAKVAYVVWEDAARELPKCPEDGGVREFLIRWSDREYTNQYSSGQSRNMSFGPPRATTLLHFVSGASYPIFDRRVRTAMARLLGQPKIPNTVAAYLDQYIPLFRQVASVCETIDLRQLDKALFSYGALPEWIFSAKR